MSEKQSEALRLADALDFQVEAGGGDLYELAQAADEIRRLHAECKALRAINEKLQSGQSRLHDELTDMGLVREELHAEREELRADAERYRWLRDLKCCSFTLGHNDAHAPSYMTASDWIDDNPRWFADTPDAELRRMRDSNTIWTLQVYPRTPVGFDMWCAATLDAAIDAARAAKEQQ